MKKEFLLGVIAVTILATVGTVFAAGGFDEFGYNYQARVFVGKADGVDRNLDGTVWGDPTYANDLLVMKWSKGWDDARFNGAPWTSDAWENNEWNGMFPGGSGAVWHYKIQWIPEACSPEYSILSDGGECIWGHYEIIMDQGQDPSIVQHWLAHAIPTGYGS